MTGSGHCLYSNKVMVCLPVLLIDVQLIIIIALLKLYLNAYLAGKNMFKFNSLPLLSELQISTSIEKGQNPYSLEM